MRAGRTRPGEWVPGGAWVGLAGWASCPVQLCPLNALVFPCVLGELSRSRLDWRPASKLKPSQSKLGREESLGSNAGLGRGRGVRARGMIAASLPCSYPCPTVTGDV